MVDDFCIGKTDIKQIKKDMKACHCTTIGRLYHAGSTPAPFTSFLYIIF